MSTIGNMMSYMLSTLVLAVFMFVLDWRLGMIAVIITLLASLVAKYMNRVSLTEAVGRQNQSENLTDAEALRTLLGAEEVRFVVRLGTLLKELALSKVTICLEKNLMN